MLHNQGRGAAVGGFPPSSVAVKPVLALCGYRVGVENAIICLQHIHQENFVLVFFSFYPVSSL